MPLRRLGWNQTLEDAFDPFRERGLVPARVAREDRGRYLLLDGRRECPAVLAGRLRHEARRRSDLPAVGDWIAARTGAAATAVIVAVLPRASAFLRKIGRRDHRGTGGRRQRGHRAARLRAGRRLQPAAHRALPGRRLGERREPGDRAQQGGPRRRPRVATRARSSGVALGVPVRGAVGAHRGRARRARALARARPHGGAARLLGRGQEHARQRAARARRRQATGAVRADDSRGRHVTTRRELVPLPDGGLLLDTPGMRELQLWGDDGGLAGAFPDVAALAADCRFRDCAHADEPGCAVRAAVERGALEPARLESWHKLGRELRRLEARQDARARAEEDEPLEGDRPLDQTPPEGGPLAVAGAARHATPAESVSAGGRSRGW